MNQDLQVARGSVFEFGVRRRRVYHPKLEGILKAQAPAREPKAQTSHCAFRLSTSYPVLRTSTAASMSAHFEQQTPCTGCVIQLGISQGACTVYSPPAVSHYLVRCTQ